MPLTDEQFEYRGLVFGRDCPVRVNSAEGFEGFEVRTSDSDQPRGDGGLRGLDYVAPRTIAFELNIAELEDVDGATYEQLWAAVRSTFRPSRDTDYPLVFKRPGQPERQILCRPIQLMRAEEWSTFNRNAYPPIVLRAVDPRLYSTELHRGNIGVYSATGGGTDFALDFDEEFIVSAGTHIEYVAENAGTADAYPLLRFYSSGTGQITGVTLTNTTTGQNVEFTADIGPGQSLTADMQAAATGSPDLVVHMDGSSRYGDWALPREPFVLAPGSNTIRFEVAGTDTDAIANIVWRDTWID